MGGGLQRQLEQMAGDHLVEGDGRQGPGRALTDRAQVDVVGAGLAFLRGDAVAALAGRHIGGGHPPGEGLCDGQVDRPRQHRQDGGDPRVHVGHGLVAPGAVVGIEVARVAGQGPQARADRTGSQTLPAQQGVGPPLQRRALASGPCEGDVEVQGAAIGRLQGGAIVRRARRDGRRQRRQGGRQKGPAGRHGGHASGSQPRMIPVSWSAHRIGQHAV